MYALHTSTTLQPQDANALTGKDMKMRMCIIIGIILLLIVIIVPSGKFHKPTLSLQLPLIPLSRPSSITNSLTQVRRSCGDSQQPLDLPDSSGKPIYHRDPRPYLSWCQEPHTSQSLAFERVYPSRLEARRVDASVPSMIPLL